MSVLLVFIVLVVPSLFMLFQASQTKRVEVNFDRLSLKNNLNFADANFHSLVLARQLGYERRNVDRARQFEDGIRRFQRTRFEAFAGAEGEFDSKDVFDAEFFLVSSAKAFSVFLDYLRQREFFLEPLTEFLETEKPRNSAEENQEQALLLAKKIKIVTADPSKDQLWGIRWTTKSPDLAVKSILQILENANANTKDDFRSRATSLIEQKKARKARTLVDLQREYENEIEIFKGNTELQLVTLKENAEIARALDIGSNTLETLPLGERNTVIADLGGDAPLYFQGYKALEKRVELLSDREDPKLHLGKLQEIENSIRLTQNDPTLGRAENALRNSVLNKEDFRVAYYNATTTKVTNILPPVPMSALAIIFCALLSVGIVQARLMFVDALRNAEDQK